MDENDINSLRKYVIQNNLHERKQWKVEPKLEYRNWCNICMKIKWNQDSDKNIQPWLHFWHFYTWTMKHLDNKLTRISNIFYMFIFHLISSSVNNNIIMNLIHWYKKYLFVIWFFWIHNVFLNIVNCILCFTIH